MASNQENATFAFIPMELWDLYNNMALDFRIFFVTNTLQHIDGPVEAELRSAFMLPASQLSRAPPDWLVQAEEQIAKEWGPPEQRTKVIFLTDRGSSEDLSNIRAELLARYAAKFSRASDPMRFYHVKASFDAIQRGLPFFTRAHPLYETLAWEVAWPSHILPGLFLGGAATVNSHTISELGLTHIVSALEEPLDSRSWNPDGRIEVLHCQLVDADSAPIHKYFGDVVQFIRGALASSDHRVLVHCAAGMSRSATLTAAYILTEGIDSEDNSTPTTDETLAYMRSRRHCVRPNAGFLQRLWEWELELRSKQK